MPGTAKPPAEYQPRAQRFPIRARFKYRVSGAGEWRDSRTVNISRSGLLFEAGEALAPRTMLEMHIKIPAELTGGEPAEIDCWGPVVRTEEAATAAAILDYRLTHGHTEWFSRL